MLVIGFLIVWVIIFNVQYYLILETKLDIQLNRMCLGMWSCKLMQLNFL